MDVRPHACLGHLGFGNRKQIDVMEYRRSAAVAFDFSGFLQAPAATRIAFLIVSFDLGFD